MCLIIKRGTQPQVAEQNIVVAKAFRESWTVTKSWEKKVTRSKRLFGLIPEKCERVWTTIDVKKLTAPFYDFDYEFGPQPQVEIQETAERSCFGDIDSEWLRNNYGLNWQSSEELMGIGAGYHSANTFQRLKDENMHAYYVIYECIIPKGSLFYVDETGLIVSNNLIVTEKKLN